MKTSITSSNITTSIQHVAMLLFGPQDYAVIGVMG